MVSVVAQNIKLLACCSIFVAGVFGGWLYYERGIPEYDRPQVPFVERGMGERREARGPLRVHDGNSRFFDDGTGAGVLLSGSHTWANFQDNGLGYPPPPFDYDEYLDFLVENNHNFIRLWAWEQSKWGQEVLSDKYYFYPGPPYQRTGPGLALDGKPRFDLEKLDPTYFDRLRDRVAKAAERGIYVSVMLFNGWSIDNKHEKARLSNPWHGHPFNEHNNINSIDGDLNDDDSGEEVHQLLVPAITAYQETYIRRVVDTVNEFDNVLYEISNESYANSKHWQYRMIDLIHAYEREKPKQHPVGMTQYQWPGSNSDLFQSTAEWVSPWEELPEFPYRDSPRPADGTKVVILDTDHLWGLGGDSAWAWKAFFRGNNPIFMDPYDGAAIGTGADAPWDIRLATWKDIAKDILGLVPREKGWRPNEARWVRLRAALGNIVMLADQVDLASLEPHGNLASTGYCLAHPAGIRSEYLVYVEAGTRTTQVDLSDSEGMLEEKWLNADSADLVTKGFVRGGRVVDFDSPFVGDAVLWLKSKPGTK